jgi:hypothetical protein
MASLAAALAAVACVGAPPAPHAGDLVARPLHARVVLRTDPGGKALVRVGPRTVFGGPVALGVVAVRGDWLEVGSEELPNGHYGWVERGRDVSVRTDAWTLHALLSRHLLFVLHRGRVVRRIPVAIGSPASPTPTGRYAVSEKLSGARFGAVYGCCILGLTAHQPHPPAGWSTGVAYYVAIHGGSGIGADVSAGCLHANEPDLRYLMRTIPLGTAIRISR